MRLGNINNEGTSRKWVMSTLEDFFIFTVKFYSPSTIRFVEIQANNTYKLDLTFKDYQQKYLCEYSIEFNDLNDTKIIEIWQHPLA